MNSTMARSWVALPCLALFLVCGSANAQSPAPPQSQITAMQAAAASGDGQAKQMLDQVMRKVPEFLALLDAESGKGKPAIQLMLGTLHEQGLFLRQDDARALDLYREAGRLGDPTAAMLVCRGIALGKGAPKDEAAALRCFNQAVKKELAASAGSPVLWGGGVPGLVKAAEGGNPLAASVLGRLHLTGNGVSRDDREAVRLLGIADRQGSGGAAILGMLHEEGRGGLPGDAATAMRYYLKEGAAAHQRMVDVIDHTLLTLALTP